MSSLVIVGAGGHAKVVCDAARLAGWSVAGFLDTVNAARRGEPFFGAVVLGGLEALDALRGRGAVHAIVAVGDNDARLRLADQIAGAGIVLATVVHPRAVVAGGAAVGPGSFVAAGAVINTDVEIGASAIVNTAASVDHDCRIADGVHLAVGARLAGRVSVGRGTWVGMGALVRDGVRIGAGSIVGAGALVLADLPDGVTAYGAPAKVVHDASRHRSVTR